MPQPVPTFDLLNPEGEADVKSVKRHPELTPDDIEF